jgi:tyrosyl-tRNA synthetase
MNAMVPGLQGAKMSSSDPNSKIDFLDPPVVVRKKVNKAFCADGNVVDNGVLAFAKEVLIPVSELRLERLAAEAEGKGQSDGQRPFAAEDAPAGTVFSIVPDGKHGGRPSHYRTYAELEAAFAAEQVHPGDLKKAVGDAIVQLLEPIQKAYQESEEWQKTAELAYPPEKKEVKKKKVSVDVLGECAG